MSTHVMAVELGRARFKIELNDEDEFQQWTYNMLRDGFVYERDTSIAIADILMPGDCFVDVGSYIGWYSMIAASIVGPSGLVLAFEPNPNNYATLCRNISINGFEDRIIAINKAVGETSGQATFWVNSMHTGVGCFWDFSKHPCGVTKKATHKTITVAVTTLDEELEQICSKRPEMPIRCIKMDVEGSEPSVLRGARRLLASRDIPYVFAEMNHFGMQQMGHSVDDMNEAILPYGYSTYLMGDAVELMAKNHVYNILFSKNNLDAMEGEMTDESIYIKEAAERQGACYESIGCEVESHHAV